MSKLSNSTGGSMKVSQINQKAFNTQREIDTPGRFSLPIKHARPFQ